MHSPVTSFQRSKLGDKLGCYSSHIDFIRQSVFAGLIEHVNSFTYEWFVRRFPGMIRTNAGRLQQTQALFKTYEPIKIKSSWLAWSVVAKSWNYHLKSFSPLRSLFFSIQLYFYPQSRLLHTNNHRVTINARVFFKWNFWVTPLILYDNVIYTWKYINTFATSWKNRNKDFFSI